MKIVQPSVKLLHATPDPLRVLERAGRVCYQSTYKTRPCLKCGGSGWYDAIDCIACHGTGTDEAGAADFVRMVLKRGHESVIEHVSAGVLIVTDRGVTHELVRHRLASFSQESTRYCDYNKEQFGGELSFIEPPIGGTGTTYSELEESGRCHSIWAHAMSDIEVLYRRLREGGTPPELARSILPNSLKSELAMTCNAREWRHFLRLRTARTAHPQMRQVAIMILDVLRHWCPVLFEDVEVVR